MVNLLTLKQSHRLVTHEDKKFFHVHKTLGVLVLGHFLYRLLIWIYYGSMMFEGIDTLIWMMIHAGLHVSSFQFELPTKRNKSYNIIWPEMRWHTLIFAYRSIIAVTMQWLADKEYYPMIMNDLLRGPLVLLTMLMADVVTDYYKKNDQFNSTTMRGNPYPRWVPEWYIKHHNMFYSISQVLATMKIMCSRDIGTLFLLLIPIQTAPFGMTLVKKGIIDQFAWHFYYTIALLINYVYGALRPLPKIIVPDTFYWVAVITFVILRFRFNLNKYILWSSIIASSCAIQLYSPIM